MLIQGENCAQFVSLSEASKLLGTTRDYLNVLIHRGKLKAKKIGRNWVTTKDWIDEYLARKSSTENSTQYTNLTSENQSLELGKIKLQHELELARLNHIENLARLKNERLIALRRIEKEEKVDLAEADTYSRAIGKYDAPPAGDDELISSLQKEKEELADFFTGQLDSLKNSLIEQESEKQKLVDELNQLRQELDRMSQGEIKKLVGEWEQREDVVNQIEFLRDSFSQALHDFRFESEQNIQSQVNNLAEQLNDQLMESKVDETLARLHEKLDQNVKAFIDEFQGELAEPIIPSLQTPAFDGQERQEYQDLPVSFPEKNRLFDFYKPWNKKPIQDSEIFFHARKRNPLRLLANSFIVGVLGLTLAGSINFAGSPAPNKISDFLARAGTEQLFFTEVGNAWAESFIIYAYSGYDLVSRPAPAKEKFKASTVTAAKTGLESMQNTFRAGIPGYQGARGIVAGLTSETSASEEPSSDTAELFLPRAWNFVKDSLGDARHEFFVFIQTYRSR